jgi:hypothetical protein
VTRWKLPLKRLHPDSIDSAIKRAERYRLLTEPFQAERICRDVLECKALRFDACARRIERQSHLRPPHDEDFHERRTHVQGPSDPLLRLREPSL